MKPADLRQLADQLATGQLLLPPPTVPRAPLPGTDPNTRVHQGLVIDLAQALTDSADAASVDIYADTLTVPNGSLLNIGGKPLRVSVIARRIVVDGSAKLVLAHDGDAPLAAVRLLVGGIEGTLQILSKRGGQEATFDLSKLSEQSASPQYTVFHFRDGAHVVSRTVIPVGLLELGRPLYNTLSASFDLCAGALGAPDAERLKLAQSVLTWITSFAGLQADLAAIGRVAESVRGILPKIEGEKRVYPIPPRSAASYLKLAHSRKELAKTIELDLKFIGQAGLITDIASQFVSANLGRDEADAGFLLDQLEELSTRRQTIKGARERVSEQIRKANNEAEFVRITLEGEMALDRIDKIVKAVFEIVGAVASLGASIAGIFVGVPPDPTAAGKKAINGVQGLRDALGTATMLAGSVQGNIITVLNLFSLPFTFSWQSGSDHVEGAKKLGAAGAAIASSIGKIMQSGVPLEQVNEVSTAVGEAIRAIADKPNAIEAKAAWDGIEVGLVNRLDLILRDAELPDAVHKAAADYKTALQKLCIQGRLLAEYQAAGDAVDREQGTLVLQRCAQLRKQDELKQLQTKIRDRPELDSIIRIETTLRTQMAARSFFETCYGFQQAVFYETYSRAKRATPRMLASGQLMESCYTDMQTDLSDAHELIQKKHVTFRLPIRLADPELMTTLKSGNVTVKIGLDHPELNKFTRVRVTSAEARLQTKTALAGKVALELLSSDLCTDRMPGGQAEFFGALRKIPFEYDEEGVQVHKTMTEVPLPPFGDWTIAVSQPKPLTETPTALLLTFSGTAFG